MRGWRVEGEVGHTKEPNSLQLDQNWFGCVFLSDLRIKYNEQH